MRVRIFFLFSVFLISVLSSVAQVSDMEKDRVQMTELNGLWRFHIGDDPTWADAGFDDSQWPLLRPFMGWSRQGYNDTGFGWYRIPVIVPAQTESLAIYLPKLVNNCQVFANGTLIGEIGQMPPHPRIVIASRALFAIPANAISPGRPLVIAIRFWRWPRLGIVPGIAGLIAPPVIGDARLLNNWYTLQVHDAYWATSDNGLSLVFNLLTALAGLALFALRPKEREYLWFGAAQVLWAAQSFVFLSSVFRPIPYVGAEIFLACAKAGAQFLNLEFFVTLMGQRKGRLYWIAAASALIPVFALFPLEMGWINDANASLGGTILDLVYGICVPALLYRGASRGNLEARLLLVPFTLSFSINVIGDLFALPGVGTRPWMNMLTGQLRHIINFPFPMSAFNLAGNLAMFSVIAVLILRYARSRKDEERLASELEAARAVQHVLIPDELPAISGYQLECVYKPAGQVGGDFFQILPLPQGGALVAIGDVSGKGMPAAMTVSLLVGMMRMLARSMQSPAAILAVMNQSLMDRMAGSFATCLFLHIAPDGVITAANAGHIAPYVNGSEVVVEGGLPLAVNASAAYAETKFQLSSDHQLTLLTDGVPEARRPDGELFGFERAASISAQPAAEIARAAEQFGQEDDITVLSITRQPSRHKSVTLAEPAKWSPAPA
jgi:hypothetical protein